MMFNDTDELDKMVRWADSVDPVVCRSADRVQYDNWIQLRDVLRRIEHVERRRLEALAERELRLDEAAWRSDR